MNNDNTQPQEKLHPLTTYMQDSRTFSVFVSNAIYHYLKAISTITNVKINVLVRCGLALLIETIDIDEQGNILINERGKKALDMASSPSLYGLPGIEEFVKELENIKDE